MRPGYGALPLLIAATACSPVQRYQEAARGLRFTLDRVDPSLELALPLDRSRVAFQVTLGVANPSTVPFHLQAFEGSLRMETGGVVQPIGQVRLVEALDLPAGGSARLVVSVSFGYRDLAQAWPAIQAALGGEASGAWELEGDLRAEVHGFPVHVPVRSRRAFGTAP
jgi:hypothetical protein